MAGRGWVSWCICGVMGAVLVTSCSDSQDVSPRGSAGADTEAGAAGKNTGGPGEGGNGGAPLGAGGAALGGNKDNLGGTTDGGTADGGTASAGLGNGGAGGVDTIALEIRLGLHCQRDTDCGQGLHCLGADQDHSGGVGAPAGGLCTVDCSNDADCRSFDPHAVCGTLDEYPIMGGVAEEPTLRLCMAGCAFGEPTGDDKCHGQRDMACRPFAPNDAVNCESTDAKCPSGSFCFRGYCREAACGPRCNVDADCGDGRVCNPGSGLCDEQAVPSPTGLDCPGDQDPDSTACGDGTCLLLFSDGVTDLRMCTQSCTYGKLCGDDGACVMPRMEVSAGGDIGYCMQRCDCDADCRHPLQKCFEWASPAVQERFQSRGVCDLAVDGDQTLDVCGAGGAGGAGGASGASGAGGAGG